MECQLLSLGRFAIVSSVRSEDIDILIGINLKRIRESHGLTQEQLSALIGTPATRLSSYEHGRDGLGKDIMARVCRALKVDLWEFYWTEKTPIVKDAREMADIQQRREAEKVGIADMVREAEASWIVAAKKKSGALREDAAARPKRTHKRAG